MFCPRCGFEIDNSNNFCPNCGNSVINGTNFRSDGFYNPISERCLYAFKDNLFFTICILITVLSVLSLAAGSIPIFQILFSIFLWNIYSSARKNTVNSNMMQCVSGTVFAQKVILIVGGICAIISLIFVFIFSLTEYDYFLKSISVNIWGPNFDLTETMFDTTAFLIIYLLFLIFFVTIAIFIVFCVAFSKIHKFAKSLYISAQTGICNIECANATKNWLMAFIILSALGTLSSFGNAFAFIAGGTQVAIYILSYILMKKYFVK